MIIDYAELLVATRARSLKIEDALQRNQYKKAQGLQEKQVVDEGRLLAFIDQKVEI